MTMTDFDNQGLHLHSAWRRVLSQGIESQKSYKKLLKKVAKNVDMCYNVSIRIHSSIPILC